MQIGILKRMQFLLPAILLFVLRYLWVRLRLLFKRRYRLVASIGFIFCIAASFLYRLMPMHWTWQGAILVALGGFVLVYLGNWLLVCLLADGMLFIRRYVFRVSRWSNRALQLRWFPRLALATFVLTGLFYAVGIPCQRHFQVTRVHLKTSQSVNTSLRIVAISDIHFDPCYFHATSSKRC